MLHVCNQIRKEPGQHLISGWILMKYQRQQMHRIISHLMWRGMVSLTFWNLTDPALLLSGDDVDDPQASDEPNGTIMGIEYYAV